MIYCSLPSFTITFSCDQMSPSIPTLCIWPTAPSMAPPPPSEMAAWRCTTMVPGVPSVMTTGPSWRWAWPVGCWASPEPEQCSLQPTLVPVPDPSGWTMCSVRAGSILCRSVHTMASEPTTATFWRMRGWSAPVCGAGAEGVLPYVGLGLRECSRMWGWG